MATVTTRAGQSLLDIAVQEGGSMEAMVDVAIANDIRMTDMPAVGSAISVPSSPDSRVTELFANSVHKPASAVSLDDIDRATGGGEGIEFWGIEYDFIVS